MKREKWLARNFAHIKGLSAYKALSRAFRHWRVLEREYGAWQRGFAASYALQETNACRRMQRSCLARALAAWVQVVWHTQELRAILQIVAAKSELLRLKDALACFHRMLEADRLHTFQRQVAANHALSACVLRFWNAWRHLVHLTPRPHVTRQGENESVHMTWQDVTLHHKQHVTLHHKQALTHAALDFTSENTMHLGVGGVGGGNGEKKV